MTDRMVNPAEAALKEMRKNRRLCLLHLRTAAALFGGTAIALLVLQHFLAIPLWIPFIILGVLCFSIAGDAFHYSISDAS